MNERHECSFIGGFLFTSIACQAIHMQTPSNNAKINVWMWAENFFGIRRPEAKFTLRLKICGRSCLKTYFFRETCKHLHLSGDRNLAAMFRKKSCMKWSFYIISAFRNIYLIYSRYNIYLQKYLNGDSENIFVAIQFENLLDQWISYTSIVYII